MCSQRAVVVLGTALIGILLPSWTAWGADALQPPKEAAPYQAPPRPGGPPPEGT